MIIQDPTDLDLLQSGIIVLEDREDEDPILRPTQCLILNEDFTLEFRHDWTPPFLCEVLDGYETEHVEIQTCRGCGGVRRPRFGPYLEPGVSA